MMLDVWNKGTMKDQPVLENQLCPQLPVLSADTNRTSWPLVTKHQTPVYAKSYAPSEEPVAHNFNSM